MHGFWLAGIITFLFFSLNLSASTWEAEIHHAAALTQRGDYANAELRLRNCLHLAKSLDQKATTWNNLGSVLVDLSRLFEAESAFRESIKLWTRHCGPDCPSSAYPLNSLGSLLIDIGKFKDAERYLIQSLNLRRQFPNEHDASPALSNLALLRLAKRDYKGAEKSIIELLEACPATKSHCLAANGAAQHNLALALAGQGRHWESIDIYRQAIKQAESLYGHAHPKLGWTYLELASAYALTSQDTLAVPLYKTVLELAQRNNLGPHPLVYRAMEEYAAMQMRHHRKAAAESLLRQARQVKSTYRQILRDSGQAVHIDSLRAGR